MKDATKKFIEEVEAAGFEVQPYHGRFFWFGPGVWVRDSDEYQDLVRATTMRLQYDSPVVYPEASDTEWYEETTGTKVRL